MFFNQSWLVKTNQLFLFKISSCNSLRLGVGDFAPCAFADVAADVDDLQGSIVSALPDTAP